MKRVLTAIIWFSVLVGVAFSAGAAELKQVLILNFPGDGYKMLQAQQVIAALKEAGFVELENTRANIITKEAAADALQRLGIPLKTVIDATVYEDWEAAVRQYNDDPEVGWMLMGVWPTIRRDGTHRIWKKKLLPGSASF